MKEEWKDIKGYEGLYQVSNTGKVRSLDRKVWNYIKKGRTLKTHNNGHGYYNISLHGNNKIEKHVYIHRLVAETFIPNPNNLPQVNHKDFNKSNNNIDNLEWVSSLQNKIHYRKSKYCKNVEQRKNEKLCNKTFQKIYNTKDIILELYNSGYTINEIKEKTKLSRDFISSVIKLFKK